MAKARTKKSAGKIVETIRAIVLEELKPIREAGENVIKAAEERLTKRPAILGVVELGDLARDRISGFEGVVIARTIWLENCDRFVLQPQKLKQDGSPHMSQSFDAPSCELIEKGLFKKKQPETGGPEPREYMEADR